MTQNEDGGRTDSSGKELVPVSTFEISRRYGPAVASQVAAVRARMPELLQTAQRATEAAADAEEKVTSVAKAGEDARSLLAEALAAPVAAADVDLDGATSAAARTIRVPFPRSHIVQPFAGLDGIIKLGQIAPAAGVLAAIGKQFRPTLDVERLGSLVESTAVLRPKLWTPNAAITAGTSIDLARIATARLPRLSDTLFPAPIIPPLSRNDFSQLAMFRATVPNMGFVYSDSMRALFDQVRTLQHRVAGLLEVWRALERVGHKLAHRGLLAALAARDAVVTGELEPVKDFMRDWLQIDNTTAENVDAVSAALLDESWTDTEPDDVVPEIKRLRAVHSHRLRPITESQLNRRRVGSLNELVGVEGGQVEVGSLVLAPDAPDPFENEIEDPRLREVIGRLDEDEIAIVNAYASGPGNWRQAAVECGFSEKRGEAVRRKTKRYADRIVRAGAAEVA